MKRLDLKNIPEAEAIREAIEVLESGGVIAYPTETFYALGARYDSEDAIERIYAMKRRSQDKAITLIVGSMGDVSELTSSVPAEAEGLMRSFWPGPLTIVLPAGEDLLPSVTQCDTLAIRVPGDSFALRLVQQAGFAITATSANPAGTPPADTAEKVLEYFDDPVPEMSPDLMIDAGPAPGGLPSTIVDVTQGRVRVLRAGAVKVPVQGR